VVRVYEPLGSVYVGIDPRVTTFIAALIAVVWAISMLADAAMKTFQAPAGVQAVMMLMSGALFGSDLLRRNKNEDEEAAPEGVTDGK